MIKVITYIHIHDIHAHEHKESLILKGSLKPQAMAPPPGLWLCSMITFWQVNLQRGVLLFCLRWRGAISMCFISSLMGFQ